MSVLGFAKDHKKSKVLAMDALQANIMIADAGLNIVYMNSAVRDLLQENEAALRRELPRFSMNTLIGSNIDVFHKSPMHQRNMLASLTKRHNATIWVGELAYDLLVSPLMNGGKRLGFVVEWANAKARLLNLDYAAQIAAISRSQAIIEFKTDGTIMTANDNFLKLLGYSLAEIQGQNHRIFVDAAYRESTAYAEFWDQLRHGHYQAAEFQRVCKNGKVVTIQASYNPIMDANGKVTKVVKFATDVTPRVHAVTEIGQALTGLAQGNLERRIDETFIPEIDKLRLDFNQAIETLQGAMQRVGNSANIIQSSTEEIRSLSDDLSQRTEQQAASLEETAASLAQITDTVRRTALGAVEAREVVAAAKSDAEKSGKVVSEAVDAMSRIEESSTKIEQIIGVIDEIAFQTNLLALNAGVEAARAGEAGRGFAVVASEVRALAQRSAEAAKEIKTLISASSDQVAHGVERVGETGKSLGRITEQVAKINGIVNDIAHSAQEQSAGLGEVNAAVKQMDQVTQQNAAMVEEATAAAHSLRGETETLATLIGTFRLGGKVVAAQAHRRPARPMPKTSAAPSATTRGGGGAAAARAPDTRADDWEDF